MRRAECGYRQENVRFLLECDFSKQYCNYYKKRLEKSRPYLEANCRSKWDPSIPIHTLAQIASFAHEQDDFSSEDDSSDLCIVIGTIVKRMKLQPDVLHELAQGEFNIKVERYLGHYLSLDDKIILEDHEESISLTGKIDASKLVTGVTVALLGQPIDDCSKFLVRDICYAEPNRMLLYEEHTLTQSVCFEQNLEKQDVRPLYLLVLSGLEFHQDMDKIKNTTQALQNIIDFIWAGGKYTDDERCSRVARLLVVGDNLLGERLTMPDASSSQAEQDIDPTKKLKLSRQVKPYTNSVKAIQHLDEFFAQLSKTIYVDIMPGYSDPTSHLMPQQPFHPCMFPKSCKYSTFNSVTNPHRAIYNGDIDILATSGQNVQIIEKFSGISDPIEIMKCHLMWGNMAPSAPDNLYSVPYEDDDPMVIDFIPEIYIAGCQDYYRRSRYTYNACKPSNEFSKINSNRVANLNSTPNQSSASSTISPFHQPINSRMSSAELPTTSTPIPPDESSTSNLGDLSATDNGNAGQKTSTVLITVPKFSETLTGVLINLKTLKSELISFK